MHLGPQAQKTWRASHAKKKNTANLNSVRESIWKAVFDFKKAFDTVPRGLLWQVLERVGIRGPILDCIKSLYAHVRL